LINGHIARGEDSACHLIEAAEFRCEGDASRVRRARAGAIANWAARVRDTYGIAYRFWSRAEDRKVECGGGTSAKHCTVSARPCRLW
jgi:hypothetical protein